MPGSVVIVGIGQLGTVFAEGFLKLGHSVVPVLQGGDVSAVCDKHDPQAVVIATGEDDLGPVLETVPPAFRNRVLLIQNELRPDQWVGLGYTDPSVAIVWFEKKKAKLPHVVLPSVLFGDLAPLLETCFAKLSLPARTVDSRDALLHELVLKNLYILGLNLTGMKIGGHAGALLTDHRKDFDQVIEEALRLEKALANQTDGFDGAALQEAKLKEDLAGAINADPGHGCAGRSAPRRLERTLAHAERAGIEIPFLHSLKEFAS